MIRKLPSKPIEKLLTAYEQALLQKISLSSLDNYNRALYSFWGEFPKIERPKDIWLTDVEKWCLRQLAAGHTQKTVQYSVRVLCAFYNWLSDTYYTAGCGSRLLNPFAHLSLAKLVDLRASAPPEPEPTNMSTLDA